MTDPRVTLRADTGAAASSRRLEGAEAAAGQALMFSRLGGRGATSISALVNGAVGVVSLRDGGPAAVLGFTVTGSRITAIDILADPDRLATLDLAALA